MCVDVPEEGLAQFNRESGGLLRVEIIRPADIQLIFRAAISGYSPAFFRLSAIFESSEKIRKMARKKPAVCLTCPRSVGDPNASLALLVPANDAATVAICSALCEKCSKYEPEIITRLAAAAYQAAWPGLRCVEVTHPEGGTA